MKARATAFAVFLACAGLGYAGPSAPADPPSGPPLTPPELAALIRRAESAVVAFENFKDQRESRDAVVTDRAWIEKLAALVEAGPLEPRAVCFCISTPRIELYDAQGRLTSLTLHHDTKLRHSGPGFGDFEIGAARSRAILDLAMSEKKNARERVVPKLKDSRPKR
ncbi:MAG: hypothetical protein C0518_09970 [Opitutus sp.]|nr:hypothetical protein [Opitutus sp.]